MSLTSDHILHITYNGEKKGICDDNFDKTAAEVACFELTGDATVNSYSGGHRCDTKDFWLDEITCRGEETTLA